LTAAQFPAFAPAIKIVAEHAILYVDGQEDECECGVAAGG
jgi:hypothetical protein